MRLREVSLRQDPDLRQELASLARGCDFVLPSRFKKRLKAFQQVQGGGSLDPAPGPLCRAPEASLGLLRPQLPAVRPSGRRVCVENQMPRVAGWLVGEGALEQDPALPSAAPRQAAERWRRHIPGLGLWGGLGDPWRGCVSPWAVAGMLGACTSVNAHGDWGGAAVCRSLAGFPEGFTEVCIYHPSPLRSSGVRSPPPFKLHGPFPSAQRTEACLRRYRV